MTIAIPSSSQESARQRKTRINPTATDHQTAASEMAQHPLDDRRLFNARNHLKSAAEGRTDLDLDAKDAFEALCDERVRPSSSA